MPKPDIIKEEVEEHVKNSNWEDYASYMHRGKLLRFQYNNQSLYRVVHGLEVLYITKDVTDAIAVWDKA